MNNKQVQNNIIAKLLATENISVRRDNVSLPYFEIKTRNLVLPQWKDMEDELEQMLIAHEVGHALFTGMEYVDYLMQLSFKGAKTYMNIIEDVRVEKFTKQKFPGIKKTFAEGYRLLYAKDFFDIKSKQPKMMILIDRINLYFKFGSHMDINFNEDEQIFVTRANSLETISDVYNLARDIYEYSKNQPNFTMENVTKNINGSCYDFDFDCDDEDDDNDLGDIFDEEFDDLDFESNSENGESNSDDSRESSKGGDGSESPNDNSTEDTQDETAGKDIPEPISDSMLNSNIEAYADTNSIYKYWTFQKFSYDPIISYKEILTKFESSYFYDDMQSDSTHKDNIRNFRQSSINNVNYLIKEFEMRKAATAYKTTTISKTGILNTKKLYGYQISDNLFKSMSIVKDGKNHGLIFLLDWSGSMADHINKTLQQLINLVMFCNRAQINFVVYAFSTQYRKQSFVYEENYDDNVISTNRAHVSLLELFSNKMTTTDMNKMINYTLHPSFYKHVFDLGGTPLAESLIFLYDYIDVFLRNNQVEKFTLVTLTDGESSCLDGQFVRTLYNSNTYKSSVARHKIVCPHTKIEYNIPYGDISEQIDMLTDMIKNRYSCDIIGFFITNTNIHALTRLMNSHYSRLEMKNKNKNEFVDTIRKEMSKNSYASLKDTAKDELFIIPANKLDINESELEINSKSGARSIAKSFSKNFNIHKTSRVLLHNIISYIA